MINLKHSFRTIFKSPFVSGVAILSLALGIGANSAIFSLFDEMLLRPLPVVEPERLVNFGAPGPNPGQQSCGNAGDCDVVFSYPMFLDLQRANTEFSGIAAHEAFGANIAFHGVTVHGEAMMVSGSYFPVLGLHAALGRLIGPQDDTPVGQNFVAVLGHGFWTSQFGGDPGIIGQTMLVNGKSMTIVGIAPRGFEGTTLGYAAQFFVPISMRHEVQPFFNEFEKRRSYWVYLFAPPQAGRLDRAGQGLDQRGVLADPLDHRSAPADRDERLDHEAIQGQAHDLEDGRRGQSNLHKQTKTPILLLMCITAIVLLIACANIANLLLARGAGRSMEMAVRLSLGATRGQIVSQLLTESVLLALIGGVASIFVARWTLAVMSGLLPSQMAGDLHFALERPRGRVRRPRSRSRRVSSSASSRRCTARAPSSRAIMRDAGTKQTGGRAAARFRTALVTAQIALSMALLVSAGLFVKSLGNVSSVDLGVKIDHITHVRASRRC